MNWVAKDCHPGDMIRVNLGVVYHYGIFLSEEEVIQFGLPPIPEYRRVAEEIEVCVSSMAVFSCARIVEVGVCDKKEAKARFSDQKVVERARAALGRKGYNLLHNNCEHFVYECAFGTPYCSVEAEALARWRSRPVFNLYLLPISENEIAETCACKARQRETERVSNPALRRQKQAAWMLLEAALPHALHQKAADLRFCKSRHGKWTAKGVYFSISHTGDYVLVAVSSAPCGVDGEVRGALEAKLSEDKRQKLRERIAREGEDGVDFLTLWTRKEAAYKCAGRGAFSPKNQKTDAADLKSVVLPGFDLVLSFCGEMSDHAKFYIMRQNTIRLLDTEERGERWDLS